ncbi:MAG: hypothetical protein WBD20_17200 [Pirellulaceae bacterium]
MLSTQTITRTLALACLTLVTSLSMTNVSSAQSISSLAENEAEYQAYIYTYMTQVTLQNLPSAIDNDIDNAETRSERLTFELEQFFALEARSDVNRAFKHAIFALKNDDNESWEDCRIDLIKARDACERLLGYQEAIGSDFSRRFTVQTALVYLDVAIPNASRAYRTIKGPTKRR